MPDSISPRPATDPAQQEMILAAVDKFLERDVAPYAHALEAKDEYPHEIVERMKELGLFGATIGEEWGGLGLDVSTYTKIVERVSAVWMSVSGIFNSHLIMAAAVERFGTEDQKSATCRVSPPVSCGRHRADRTGRRHRPARHSHTGRKIRRWIRAERHQNLDLQLDPGQIWRS